MITGELIVQRDENKKISTITLNRPQFGNSLTWDLGHALQDAVKAESDWAQCIVLAATGRNFCSGVDLQLIRKLASPEKAQEVREKVYGSFQGLIRGIATCVIPVVARIQGPVLGVGADLVLACDIRVASTDAWFEESWIRLGTTSALGGGHILPALIGMGGTLDLLLTARRLSAEEGHRVGIFQRLTLPDDLDREVDQVSSDIASADCAAVRATKSLVRGPDIDRLDRYLEAALEEQVSLIAREEFAQRVDSVLERISGPQKG